MMEEPADTAQPRVLFVNGFHRSGTTVISSALTEAVGGVTTTAGVLARHIPAVAAVLADGAGREDRGVDRLAVTAETAEEYGFLLTYITGARALYGHPDGVTHLRGHIAELAADAPGRPIVLKNPWDVGREADMLVDFPSARIIILRRRLADIERSLEKALVRTKTSAYARALEPDDAGHERYQRQIQSPWRRALLLQIYRWALRRRVYGLAGNVGRLPLDRIAVLSYDELRADPQAGAAWAAHLVDPQLLAEAFVTQAFAEPGVRARSSALQRVLDRRWTQAWDEVRRAQVRAGLLAESARPEGVSPTRAAPPQPRPRRAPVRRAVTGAIRLGILAHSSPRTRRVVPVAVAFRLAEPYAAWARRSRGPRWERFRRLHERLLEHTPLAGSEEDVAERQCAEMFRSVELFWRPWLMESGEIEGIEHFYAARSRGRGVVAVFPHFGVFYAQYTILPRFGIEAWGIVGSHHFEDLGNGYPGRFTRQARAYVNQLGPEHVITTGKAFRPALELLRQGATVSVAFDLVGSTPTPFLGHTLSLASGASRLPYEADAMVAPFVVRRVGHRPVLKFAPPIDPRDYDDAASLQVAIAKVMERWALEMPEAIWPLRHNGTPLIHGPDAEMEADAVRQREPVQPPR